MTATTSEDRLRAALDNADFPADKDALLDAARRNDADEQTVRALRAVPPVDYGSFSDVLASVAVADGGPDSDSGKAAARRHRTKPGLAEHDEDVSASPNPIVDELGENRGS
ncbi:MAG: DUF2795 domain-containing protein [Pseudonocardiaceae bacterium]